MKKHTATVRAEPVEALRQAQGERIFQFPIRVYWEDTDAGGIVFYANYLKFFERARTEWLRSLGVHQQALRESAGGLFVVSEAQIKYHLPARLDDALIVTASLLDSGRASLTIAQKAYLLSPNLSAAGPSQGARTPSGGSAAREAASVGANLSAAGPSQGARALGALLCEGSVRVGWVDANTLKPARIPQTVLEILK